MQRGILLIDAMLMLAVIVILFMVTQRIFLIELYSNRAKTLAAQTLDDVDAFRDYLTTLNEEQLSSLSGHTVLLNRPLNLFGQRPCLYLEYINKLSAYLFYVGGTVRPEIVKSAVAEIGPISGYVLDNEIYGAFAAWHGITPSAQLCDGNLQGVVINMSLLDLHVQDVDKSLHRFKDTHVAEFDVNNFNVMHANISFDEDYQGNHMYHKLVANDIYIVGDSDVLTVSGNFKADKFGMTTTRHVGEACSVLEVGSISKEENHGQISISELQCAFNNYTKDSKFCYLPL